MERIGIFGGSFNPPHLGHLTAAAQAISELRLTKLLVIPANLAPNKQASAEDAGAERRAQMLRLCFGSMPQAEVCALELHRAGVSYTWETVAQLKREHPNAELILLVGADAFLKLDQWVRADEIFRNASIAALHRGDRAEDEMLAEQRKRLKKRGATVYLCRNQAIPLSSTDVRRLLALRAAHEVLSPAVEAYIRENGLYGTGESYRNLPLPALEKTVVRLLNERRVAHVLGCRDAAVALARRYGVSEVDAARAALLHDITKALDGPLQLNLCRAYGVRLDDFSARNVKTLHALTGAMAAQEVFGENPAVVSAIRSHTTGKANMTTLEKILYIADYIEPSRDFPGVDKLRRRTAKSLDGGVLLGLQMTMEQLNGKKAEISPESLEAIDFLTNKERKN